MSAGDTRDAAPRGDARRGAPEPHLRATIDAQLDPHVVFTAVRDEAGTIVDFRYADANPAACAYNRLSRRDLIGETLLRRLPGVRPSGLFAAYCHVVETGEPLVLDAASHGAELSGDERPYYDIRGVKLGDGLAVTWRDVTDRHLALEALRAQRDLAVALSAVRELDDALRLIMEAAVALGGVDSGGVYLVDPETRELRLAAHAGLSPAFVAAVSTYPPEAANTRVVRSGVSVFASYAEVVRRLDLEPKDLGELGAFAVVPVRHDGVVIAALVLASHEVVEFDRRESSLIEALAAQVAGAIARLRGEDAQRERPAQPRAVSQDGS